MDKENSRRYSLDGDTIIVKQVYDAEIGQHRHDYPDFDENPRITPTGKRWVSAFKDDCSHSISEYGDCGSCPYFRCERQGDLIGICDNDVLRITVLESEEELERKEA